MTEKDATDARRLVDYADVRDSIEDGDVFLFSGAKWESRLIERVTASHYSHSGLAARWDSRLMILQAEIEGVQAIPLSVAVGGYNGAVDWYRLTEEARQKVDMGAILGEAKSDLGVSYATLQLFEIGWHEVFANRTHNFLGRLLDNKLPPDAANPNALFCSEYVERCYRKGGLPLSAASDIGTSPGDIAASPHLSYGGTIQHDRNHMLQRTLDDVNG